MHSLISPTLSGLVPNSQSNCLSLQKLHLLNNSFQGEIPKDLSSLRGLEELDLSHDNFLVPITSYLGELALNNLNLYFNQGNYQ